MKAIVLLAVLLVAAQSTPVHEIYRGFVLNLPIELRLKSEILNNGVECLNSIQGFLVNTISSLQYDIYTHNVEQTIRDVFTADAALQSTVAPKCMLAYQQLASYLIMNSQNKPRFDREDFTSLAFLQARLIQTSGRVIEELAHQNFFNAGEKLALMYKMSFGMVVVEVPPVEQFNFTHHEAFNIDKFLNKFVSGFLRELGANDKQVNGTVACAFDLVNTVQRALSNPNLHRGDFFTATTAFLEGGILVTDSLKRCSQMVDIRPIAYIASIAMRYPLQFIVKVYSNEILEMPAIMQSGFNMSAFMSQGDYTSAGRAYAQAFKIAYKDIIY